MNSTLQDILKEKFIGLLFQIVSIAAGVFIGLSVENCQEEKKEMKAYISLLKAMQVEANYNKIIQERFAEHFNKGVIYVEFSTKSSGEFASNKIFLENAPDKLIESLTNYGIWLSRANNFREAAERMFLTARNQNVGQNSTMIQPYTLNEKFRDDFKNVIENCKKEIDGVLNETNDKSKQVAL